MTMTAEDRYPLGRGRRQRTRRGYLSISGRLTVLRRDPTPAPLPRGNAEAVAEAPVARTLPEGLASLARRGLVRLGRGNAAASYPELPPVVPPGTARRLIDEEREER